MTSTFYSCWKTIHILSYSVWQSTSSKTFDKVDKAIGGELKDMRKHSAISDIFDGVTQGNIIGCASHSKEYWENRDNVTSEAFAHMFEAQFDKERYEQMGKYFQTH